MPAARYWRAVGLQSVGGGALELSALHLYLGGVRVDAAATLTSAIAPAGGSLAALQDDDTATTARWLDVSAPGFALVWDFGVGAVQDVAAVRLGAGATYAEWLETLTLQHSSDGVVWATLGSIPAFSWPGAETMQEVPQAGDPHWDNVVALLHFDTDLSDSATGYWAGGSTVATSQSVFGGGSLYVYGNTIQRDTATPLLPLNGDFTFECFVKPVSVGPYGGFVYSQDPNLGSTRGANIIIGRAGQLYLSCGGYIELSSIPGTVPYNEWSHIAATRDSNTFRLFAGGNIVDQKTYSGSLGSTSFIAPRIGEIASQAPGDTYYTGYIDELRITKGVARYTANFAPPAGPFPSSIGRATTAQRLLRSVPDVPPILLSGGSAGDIIPVLLPTPIHLDRQDANGTEAQTSTTRYRIPGPRWVKEKTASTNVPLRRRVQLYNQRDSRLVREVWSDPVTGEYSFDNIRGDTKYFVIAFDHTGHYRAVIADNLTPEPIP